MDPNPSIDIDNSDVQLDERLLANNQASTGERAHDKIKTNVEGSVQIYFKRLMEGCGRELCAEVNCACHPDFVKVSEEVAAHKAIDLAANSFITFCTLESPPKSLQVAEVNNLFEKFETDRQTAESRIKEVLESSEALNLSFCVGGTAKLTTAEHHNLDLEGIADFFEKIMSNDLQEIFSDSVTKLFETLEIKGTELKNPQELRLFVILLLNPMFLDPCYMELFSKLTVILAYLPEDRKETIINWLSKLGSTDSLKTIVQIFQQYITINSLNMENIKELHCSIEALDLVSQANDIGRIISHTEFYNDAVNNPEMDLKIHYKVWLDIHHLRAQGELINSARLIDENLFSFCNYSWIMDPSTKSYILDIDSALSMNQSVRETMVSHAFFNPFSVNDLSPYLVLRIHREKIVEDTLNQLILDPKVLKKPLKVEFVGEQGIDEGGVKKEFFQLIVKELFDPKYGMFDFFEDIRVFYFNGHSFESKLKFELIGCILGLAIYNRVILDVHFPMVVYRKLAGFPVDLEDLKGVNPDMYRSFEKLLTYTGDVENDFCFTFQVVREVFGEIKTYELKPNGDQIPVTADNREEFVKLYTEWYLNDVCDEVFQAFHKGFHNVAGGKAFQLFKPEELEQLVCGERELDFHELEKATEYEDGYTKDSDIVKYFWEIVYEYSEEQKRALLAFATGSDRSPIGGLRNLEFFILRHGEDSDRLPTAHTCFNYLLIPEYSSKEKLKERLTLAINNSQGFGLL
eukprot:CAMPEP_0115007470 /NCGR_PEP_ID=MMETSP0216-20121206/21207_1 /TAXON_ID=223996 /ORGANISM="Protocruzia adherens, Strain Boccale" /LENGTH=744 /DNA_ID=CAMNT_0002374435 /DNA_START=239 /DNA_END=2473 /DNA_ORIENTATION=-